MKPKRRKAPRHTFRIKVPLNDGKREKEIKSLAVAKRGRITVRLTLTAANVRRSMVLDGVGNSMTCSMAVCTVENAELFDHPTTGYLDWYPTRAYVSSKDRNNLPVECYIYAHGDEIAKLNDTRGGQQKLLEQLERDGPRVITLYPPPPYKKYTGKIRKGKYDGTRSKGPGTGGKLRYARAKLGGAFSEGAQ